MDGGGYEDSPYVVPSSSRVDGNIIVHPIGVVGNNGDMFFALFYRAYDFDDPTYIDLASNASQPVFNTKGKYPGRRMAIACKILKFPKLTGGEQDLNPPNNYGLGEVLHTVLVGFPQNENYGGQFVTQGDAVTRGGYNSNLDAFASVAVEVLMEWDIFQLVMVEMQHYLFLIKYWMRDI